MTSPGLVAFWRALIDQHVDAAEIGPDNWPVIKRLEYAGRLICRTPAPRGLAASLREDTLNPDDLSVRSADRRVACRSRQRTPAATKKKGK